MIVKQPDQKFPTAPQGTHGAVCVDEIDLGLVKSTYNNEERERHMVRLVWQLDEVMTDAEADKFGMERESRYVVKQDYTASLDEKANLRKHLDSWRGRAFTPEELMGFDMENLIGVPCLLSIVHAAGKKGGIFANVGTIMKLPKSMQAIKPADYIRVKDRVTAKPTPPPAVRRAEEAPPMPEGITDDDLPF